jgi:outer membrane protein assembly factor BamB
MKFSYLLSRSRHKWFPVLVVAVAAVWWVWHSSYADYYTLVHVVVTLLSAIAIAAWFQLYGGASRRVRIACVGTFAAALVVFFISFRPVYNGDMGVYRWRLRFAKSEDSGLALSTSKAEIAELKTSPRDYPRFLGTGYWPEVKDVELETDWKMHPPRELWRHEIGGGWASFAIVGEYAFTQEQRGENEIVTCYRLQTGEPVWSHADAARFDPADAIGGLGDIGPRATPTVLDEKVFTQGGTGIVNCLDARTGNVIWSHDTAVEFDAPIATWGKAGSPLIVNDTVVISVGAPPPTSAEVASEAAYDQSLVAFDIATGKVRWHAGNRPASYASPVLATIAGERQIIVVNESWVTGHRASDGKVLWEHPWADEQDHSASCAQPVPLGDNRLFLSKGYGVGCALLTVESGSDGHYVATADWQPPTKKVMKSKFSNVLVRDQYIYGLDDVLLECIERDTGKVKWRKRRDPVFGHGQVMLIGNTILVLSETGELTLVEATPEEYRELATMQALADSNVTWNNPAFSAPYLLLRNAREAVCYELWLK